MEPKYLNININCNQIKYSTGRAYLIAMPHKSDYDGFAFWFPMSLVDEGRHERAMKAVQTKLEKYTPAELKDITRRQVETRRKMPNYQQWLEEHRRAMNTPEARAKQRAAVRARWPKINENYHWVNRYFICDCEIDGHEFREGEWIRNTSPIYDKANIMQLVYPLNELPEDTKALAIERRTWYLNIRARCRKWFTRRPDIIYGILDAIITL